MWNKYLLIVIVACIPLVLTSSFDLAEMNMLARSPESRIDTKSTIQSPIGTNVYPVWDLQPLDQLHMDTVEDLPNLLPRLAAKYKLSTDDWVGIKDDPRIFLLSEVDPTQEPKPKERELEKRRGGGTLSIVQPMDVLRQRMLMEIARRNQQMQVRQVIANRDFLDTLGKRSSLQHRIKKSHRLINQEDPEQVIRKIQDYDDYAI